MIAFQLLRKQGVTHLTLWTGRNDIRS